jgi:2,6-dihydroxypseudooxynicotine hydrolase
MAVKGGRLEFLVPHLLRGQLLRPRFVRLSLRLGFARQMPEWAKLQFTNHGVSREDLDRVLGRVTSLTSWVDEWESLARAHEQSGLDALALGRPGDAAPRLLSASAAYGFAQYVLFIDIARKRALHDACVRAYTTAAPLLDPPAVPFEVPFRRSVMRGWLRRPRGAGPAPVVVLFHGTNAVKEELHGWGDALLERGMAVILFDGPGLGGTFHRLSMVAEPRPVGTAILDRIAACPDLDPARVAMFGLSLGGYLAIRMASHDRRVRAVAAVSAPYSADIYWNVTLAAMRRELASLYDMDEREMGASIHRITLADALPRLRCPLLIAGGGHDLITPASEAWRIFEDARCEREILFYPRAAHDCFNVLGELRPRIVTWLAARLGCPAPAVNGNGSHALENDTWMAAEAVDPDFADALAGEDAPRLWRPAAAISRAAHWGWAWTPAEEGRPEVVVRREAAVTGIDPGIAPVGPDVPDILPV